MEIITQEEAERLAKELSDKVNALVTEYEENSDNGLMFCIENTGRYEISFNVARDHFMVLEADKLKSNDPV